MFTSTWYLSLIRLAPLIRCHLFLVLCFFMTECGLARSSLSHLKHGLHTLDQEASVSLLVSDSQTGQTLYSHRPHQFMMPASTQKIITTLIAKLILPEASPFFTQLFTSQPIVHGKTGGDLIIQGGGDPTLTYESLEQNLKALGLKRINGRIFLNAYAFDDRIFTPGSVWEEINDCYAAPISALSTDQNCFNITLASSNDQQHMHITSDLKAQTTVNKVRLDQSCGQNQPDNASIHHTVYTQGAIIDHWPFHQRHTLQGCWSLSHGPESFKISITNPLVTLKKRLESSQWVQSLSLGGGIQIDSRPYPKHRPEPAAIIPSQNLTTLINTCLKESDNGIANHLFKRFDQVIAPKAKRASWEGAERKVIERLKSLGVDTQHISYADGAGLSRNNRLTAHQLHHIQQMIYHDPSLQSLVDALPCNDDDGSKLKKRLGQLPIKVCAKTGALNGVVTLAGYIRPHGKRPRTFTLFINGHKDIFDRYHDLELSLIQAMADL